MYLCFTYICNARPANGRSQLRKSYITKPFHMNVDNAKSQMRKGMLEYCILLLLSRQSSYAIDIITKLKEAELIVVEGTLYPLLTRLKKDGLLAYEWQESKQGPPRKYYTLTADGQAFLNELDTAWNELAYTVGVLKNPTAATPPPPPSDETPPTPTEEETTQTPC